MDSSFLFSVFVFLAAACAVVPLAGKLRLGSVVGYLAAGVLIGPFGLQFIEDHSKVMHFAEFGVVMMLFLIGLELDPATLWRLRKAIVGLGGLQILLTIATFSGIGLWLGHTLSESMVVGMALALSSTALVLQTLQEKGWLHTSAGEASFAVLLFQDIAVIPMMLVIPMLAGGIIPSAAPHALAALPDWLHALLVAGVIVAIVFGGRYVSRYLFRFVARTNVREVFTATSLALVVGVTLLMQTIGISPALGAFVAGVVLANSEYRHTLETDIQPFKGLLLGLFLSRSAWA